MLKPRLVKMLLIVAIAAATAATLWTWSRWPHYPSRPEPVSFSNADVRLSGILVSPETPGPHPAVVFIHGSGPSTIDDPFWTYHAAAFVKRGIAVLVYDKRGSGKSGGTLATADYNDLAGDVTAAVKYLRTRGDIRHNAIGLLGRSEGGWIAPLAARSLDSLAFIVFSAGPVVPQLEETMHVLRLDLLQRGASPATADSVVADRRARMLAQAANRTGVDAIPFYDPLPALRALTVPLLALYADNDEAIPTDSCVAVLKQIREEGRRNITIRTFQHVSHSFLLWRRPPVFARGYLPAMANFAFEHTRSH